jgi:hypothetical protein
MSGNGLIDLLNSEWFEVTLKDPQRVHFLVLQQLIMAQQQPRMVREHYFSVASVVVDMLLEDLPELRAEVMDALQADLITGADVAPESAYVAESVTSSVGGVASAAVAAEVALPDEIVWASMAAPVFAQDAASGRFAQDGSSDDEAPQQPPARSRARVPASRKPQSKDLVLVPEVQKQVHAHTAPAAMKEMSKTAAANALDVGAVAWSVLSIGATALALCAGSPMLAVKAMGYVNYSLLPTATDRLVRLYSQDASRKIVGFIILAVCLAAMFLTGYVDATFTTYVEQQAHASHAADQGAAIARANLNMTEIGVHAWLRTAQAVATGSNDPRQMNVAEYLGEHTQYMTATYGLPLTKTYPAVKAWVAGVERMAWFLPESVIGKAKSLRGGFDFIDDRIAAVQTDDGSMAIAMRKSWNVVEVVLLPYESLGHKQMSRTIVREASILKSALQLMWRPIILNGLQQMFLLASGFGLSSGIVGTLARRVRERLRGGTNSQKVGLRLTMQEPHMIERTYNAVFSNRYVTGALSSVNRYVLSPQMNAVMRSNALALAPIAAQGVTALYGVIKGFNPAVSSEVLEAQLRADPTVLQVMANAFHSFMSVAGPLAVGLHGGFRQDAAREGGRSAADGSYAQDVGVDMTRPEAHMSPAEAVEVAIDEGNLATVLRLLPDQQWSRWETADFIAVAVGATMAVDRSSLQQLMIIKAVLSLPHAQNPFGAPSISDEQAKLILIDLVVSGEDDETLARLLLHYGADPNYRDTEGSLLTAAVGKNEKKIILALLHAGAEVNLRAPVTPLQVAVGMRDPPVDLDVLRILLNAGASVYSESPDYHAPVIMALEGDTTAVNEMVMRHTLTKASPAPPADLREAIQRRLHNTSGPVRRSLQF